MQFQEKNQYSSSDSRDQGIWGEGGIRILILMISHNQDECWSRRQGPNDLLLLISTMFLFLTVPDGLVKIKSGFANLLEI